MTRRFLCNVLLLLFVCVVLVAACAIGDSTAWAQDAKQSVVRDFNATAALQNNGLYARAAERWTQFIQKYPNDERLDRVHYYLGICQLHAKKFPESAKAFETVLSRWPNFAQADGAQYNIGMAYYQLANASKKAEDFVKAAQSLAVVASKYPQSPHAHKSLYFQGESYYSAGEPAKAVEAYNKLVTAYASSTLLGDALYALGTTQQELNQVDAAAATFARFLSDQKLAKHELAGEIRLRLGMVLFDQKKFSEAETHFAELAKVQEFSHADFALLRQAQCRLEAGKTAEAISLFVELTTKYPNSTYKSAALLAAGKGSYLADNLDQANTALRPLADSADPEAAEAAYWLGRTLLKQRKPTDALAVLEKAAGRFTQGEFAPYLQVARIDALYELPDRRAETVALYRQFVEQNADHPLTPQATYMTALAALGAEDFSTARQFAESFLSNPKNADHELTPAVLYIAGEACLLPTERGAEGGDAARAEQLYRQLVQKYPDHARAARSHLRIGWCLYQASKHNEAVTYLQSTLGQLKDASHVAEAQLLTGRSHAAAESAKHKEAIQAYDAALAAKPDWSRADEVLLAAAQSLRELGDANGAGGRLRKLVDSYPNSELRAHALYQLGEIAQEQEQPDECTARFQEVLAKYADSEFAGPAQYGLALAQFGKEQYDEARKALDALLAGTPDPQIAGRGRYLRGLVLQRKNEFNPAVTDLEEFLKSNPDEEVRLNARYALALCRVGLKQFDQAAAELTSILGEKPDHELAEKIYYELGHALNEQDKSQESAKAFRTLAEQFPDSPLVAESWFHVGTHHEQQSEMTEAADAESQQFAQAAEAFAKGLEKAGDAELKEKLQYKLGDMRFRQENYAEAAKVLLAQIREHPQGELAGPARYLAAESLIRQDDFQQSLPLFEKVAADKVEQYHAEALFGAGKCAKAMENWPVAETHFSSLASLFPEFAQIHEARYGHALALHKQNKVSEAAAIYDQITKATETETAARSRFMIGEIAFSQKKYAEAIEHYLEVAVGYPYKELQGLAQYETGRCLVELGEKEKAVTAFKVVVEKHADHPQVENAKRLIAELQK